MDLETANELINSSVVQKYIENIDADAEAALDEMNSNIGGMSDYPSHFITEYKADGAALDKAWGDFNGEWNKIVVGQAKDGKAAMTAYSRYVLTLCVLEEQNVRFGAYVEYNVAGRSSRVTSPSLFSCGSGMRVNASAEGGVMLSRGFQPSHAAEILLLVPYRSSHRYLNRSNALPKSISPPRCGYHRPPAD